MKYKKNNDDMIGANPSQSHHLRFLSLHKLSIRNTVFPRILFSSAKVMPSSLDGVFSICWEVKIGQEVCWSILVYSSFLLDQIKKPQLSQIRRQERKLIVVYFIRPIRYKWIKYNTDRGRGRLVRKQTNIVHEYRYEYLLSFRLQLF